MLLKIKGRKTKCTSTAARFLECDYMYDIKGDNQIFATQTTRNQLYI
jgi:hypothetical protein